MRLIDADALLDKQESLYMKGNVLFHGVTACAIENAPTIDPEALPIVQELRAQRMEEKTMDESRNEMMEDIADTVRALCEALQDGCDDESTREYSKAACRLARAYALLSSTR